MTPGLDNIDGEGIDDDQLRVYIAGPYTHGSWGDNVRNALIAGQRVYDAGHIPFIPHAMTGLWSLMFSNEWIKFDLCWLEVCDAMVRLPGESSGSDTEEEFALENGIPVYHSVDSLISDIERGCV